MSYFYNKQAKKYKHCEKLFVTISLRNILKAWSDDLLTRDQAFSILIEQVINSSPNKDLLMALGPQDMLATGDVVEPFHIGGERYLGIVTILIHRHGFFGLMMGQIGDSFTRIDSFI
jgi:hypothetical protein